MSFDRKIDTIENIYIHGIDKTDRIDTIEKMKRIDMTDGNDNFDETFKINTI